MDLGKVVNFTNITGEDFSHPYNGQPFSVKAGETVMLPFDLADHLATHLARKIMISEDKSATVYDPTDKTGGQGKPLFNAETEKKMKERILGDVSDSPVMKEKTEVEMLRERIGELNKQVVPTAELPTQATIGYKDKAEVIAELTKRDVQFDARASKANLEKLLV